MDAVGQLSAALAGRYTVDREIGRGGMATVYLARDVRHQRKVALKVLSPELGAVLGVERFLSEIQVTANLQHPNLLPLFDSGEADGLLFYVMPFVEGESLRATIQREKQLPIDEAVHIATSIASALDYAHRHGVIHRDLKPENILMHDGQPLIADFGIALAVSNAGGNRITQTGLSLGTPHYMSPEQATGDRVIDGRTDIYSLGAVTYEMLVGEPPHDGKTSQAIIAKVLTDKPRSIRLSRETVPPHVAAAVERALAKLPADRFHTAHEFADALSGKSVAAPAPPVAAVHTQAQTETRTASRPRSVLPWAIAVAALTLGAAGWRLALRPGGDIGVVRYEIPLPPNSDFSGTGGNQVAISQSGRYVAYVARRSDATRRIFLRAADELQPREIPGSENSASPFFSPDGSAIGFFANGQLVKAPLNGGKVEVVAEGTGEGTGVRGATWSPSGWIIASDKGRLTKTPAVGGTPQPLTRVDSAKGETAQFNPVALSDGKTVLYTSSAMGGAANSRIAVASIADGTTKILDLAGSFPLGVLDGYLVYTTAAGTLMAAAFDKSRRQVTGPPLALVDQAAVDLTTSISYAQMASDGSLVYVSGVTRRQLAMVGPSAASRSLGEAGAYSWPRLSPDGKRLAVSVGPLSQRDVWLYQLPSGPFTRFTTEGVINDRPEWTSDGKSVLFRSNRRGRNAVWIQPVDGGAATLLLGRTDSQIDEGVLSPDGAYLLVQRDSTGNGELWYRAMRGDTTLRHVVTGNGAGAYGGRFSPDGKWIAYTSTESGIEQVYLRSFPSLTSQFQVSLTGGSSPVWSADGKRIFYVNGGELMVATLGGTQPFTVASRAVVLSRGYTFTSVHADYDVARDGTILALQSPNEDTRLVVVRNLGAELHARVRGTPR
jgi:eukaryotic-like serine/threonine-protein kinase